MIAANEPTSRLETLIKGQAYGLGFDLAGITTLVVVWFSGAATIADRAQARAEAVAIVDNVPVLPVPAVHTAAGLILGLIGAAAVAAVGLEDAWTRGGK